MALGSIYNTAKTFEKLANKEDPEKEDPEKEAN